MSQAQLFASFKIMENDGYDDAGDVTKKSRDDVRFAEPEVTTSKVNGEHSVEVEESGELLNDKPYSGMNKEDLLRFSDTPFWNRMRLGFFVSSLPVTLRSQ